MKHFIETEKLNKMVEYQWRVRNPLSLAWARYYTMKEAGSALGEFGSGTKSVGHGGFALKDLQSVFDNGSLQASQGSLVDDIRE